MKSLKELVRELSNKLEIMNGRTKGENIDIASKSVTIIDYDFIHDADKEYAVYVVKEFPELFFYGGMVLSEQLKTLDAKGAKDIIKTEGLPIKLTPIKSKKGRSYFGVEFYPED